jgi:hypothetical protein
LKDFPLFQFDARVLDSDSWMFMDVTAGTHTRSGVLSTASLSFGVKGPGESERPVWAQPGHKLRAATQQNNTELRIGMEQASQRHDLYYQCSSLLSVHPYYSLSYQFPSFHIHDDTTLL